MSPLRQFPPVVHWERDAVAPKGLSTFLGVQCLLWQGLLFDRFALASLSNSPQGVAVDELLSKAFALEGEELPRRFSNLLSFVLWDGRCERLFAVADPSGAYPLFFTERGREVAIASNVEALLTPDVDRLLPASVAAHLCGLAPGEGTTYFRGIHALPPGATLSVDRRSVTVRAAPSPRHSAFPRDRDVATRSLRESLLSVVPDYAPAREPVGITVSSGLDSTTVAAVLRAARPAQEMIAFVWTSRGVPNADESEPAARVALSLGMKVVEVAADRHGPLSSPEGFLPETSSPRCNIYREVWRETYRKAREHGVEVLLTGQGGDLAFGGGVFPFADLFLTGRWLQLAREVGTYRRKIDVDLAWLIRYRILGRSARWFLPLRRTLPPAWLGPALLPHVPRPSTAHRFALPGDRERRLLLSSPRRFAINAAATAEAAECGIDLRHPWLDPRLLDFARSFPATWTFVEGLAKAPVRRAMRGLLPDEILDRAEKIYPTELFRRALTGPGRAKIASLLEDMRAADLGFIEPKELRRAIDDYTAGLSANGVFWHALTLEAWLRRMA